MGLFDRFRKGDEEPPLVKDPVFGEIDHSDDGDWEAFTFFEPVHDDIVITGPAPEPTDEQRQLFVQLKERYPSLSIAIARCLLELYRPHLATAAEEGRPHPRTAEDMGSLTGLNSIEFGRTGEMRLGYGFRDDKDVLGPIFTVRILGWQPTGESVDMDDD